MLNKNVITIIFICLINITVIWYLRLCIRVGASDKGIILFWLFFSASHFSTFDNYVFNKKTQ